MTLNELKPYPAGQCFGPKCTARAREKDQALIPRFCSDPCRQRFVVEHALRASGAPVVNPPAAVMEIHDGERWRPVPGVAHVELVTADASPAEADEHVVHFKPAVLRLQPDPAEVQERVRELGAALAPVLRQIGLVLQRVVDAVRPAVEQLHALARETPPTDPRARALWLQQRRNTGPAAKPQRAPRSLGPAARRRTR
ncbi:hypothetical protein [Lentzea sp. NPDC059081]|uniref:hypothetical protein n=1 Tax=Lentzea sp. NPDC059081 TaxID=3346719 RepID=UPI0036842C67